jgi:hypothetical protein
MSFMLLNPHRFGIPAVSIADPTLLDAATFNGSQSTITSLTVAPTPHASIFVCQASRHSGSRTHTAPTTSGLSLATAWTSVRVFTQQDTDAGAWVHGSMWWARASDTPGSGTIQANLGGTCFSGVIASVQIVGANLSAPVGQDQLTQHETGTSIAAALGNAPAASSVGLGLLARRVNDPSYTFTGFAELSGGNIVSGLQWSVVWDRGSPPQTLTFGTLVSGEAEGLIYAEIVD